ERRGAGVRVRGADRHRAVLRGRRAALPVELRRGLDGLADASGGLGGGPVMPATALIAWCPTQAIESDVPDTRFYRDAANVVAQRNDTNPQTLRVYGTWTDASNYERLALSGASGGPFAVTSQAAGSGTVRNLKLDHG